MAAASREAAEGLLADAKALLEGLRPGLDVATEVLSGDPSQELMRVAKEVGAETIFIGRSILSARPPETDSGVVRGWTRNRKATRTAPTRTPAVRSRPTSPRTSSRGRDLWAAPPASSWTTPCAT